MAYIIGFGLTIRFFRDLHSRSKFYSYFARDQYIAKILKVDYPEKNWDSGKSWEKSKFR